MNDEGQLYFILIICWNDILDALREVKYMLKYISFVSFDFI